MIVRTCRIAAVFALIALGMGWGTLGEWYGPC